MLPVHPSPAVLAANLPGCQGGTDANVTLYQAWPALQTQQARWQPNKPKVTSRSDRSRHAGKPALTPNQLPMQNWRATPANIRAWQKRGELVLPGKGGIPGNVGLLLQALRADGGLSSTFSGLDQKPLPRDRPLSEIVVLAGIQGDANSATALGMRLAQIMKTYSPGDMPVRLFGVSISVPVTGPAVFHHSLGDGDTGRLNTIRQSSAELRQELSDFIYRVAHPSLNPVEASLLDDQAFLDLAAPLIESLSDKKLRDGGRKTLAAYRQAHDNLRMQSKAWWRGVLGQLADLRETLKRAGGASLLAVPASEVRALLSVCASDSELLQWAGAFVGVLQLAGRD